MPKGIPAQRRRGVGEIGRASRREMKLQLIQRIDSKEVNCIL